MHFTEVFKLYLPLDWLKEYLKILNKNRQTQSMNGRLFCKTFTNALKVRFLETSLETVLVTDAVFELLLTLILMTQFAQTSK